jgi:hypothetical protein
MSSRELELRIEIIKLATATTIAKTLMIKDKINPTFVKEIPLL